MATSRRQKYESGTSQGTIALTMNSIGAGAGRVSTQQDNNDATQATAGKNIDTIIFHCHVRAGAVAPTAGKTYEFYLVRGDSSTHVDGNLGTADAAVSISTLRDQVEFVYAIPVINTASQDYYFTFLVYNPGEKWSILFWNGTDQTTDTTAGNFYIKYAPVTDTFL